MSKIRSEVDNLIRYEHSKRDDEILKGIQVYGGVNGLVANTDFKRRTVHRRLAAMRKEAARFGYNQEHPEASTVTELPIRGKSILIKHDPPLPTGEILTWKKTKSEDTDVLEAIKAAVEGMQIKPVKPKKSKVKPDSNVLPILTIADAHLGLLAYEGETGSNWELRDSLTLLKGSVRTLIDKMGNVPHAMLVDAGDMTHTDGLIAKTPQSGNPLDTSCRYFEMCRAASELMRYTIDLMLTKANKVTVISVRGNHNDQTAWHINEQMKVLYSKEKRVEILSNDAYTIPYVWQDNLIVVTHGDAAKNEKMYQYITTKWPEKFGPAAYTYVIKGHVHHTRQEAIGNVMFETHSTLTKSDAYHEFKMYKSLRSMNLVNLHPEGGEDSRHTFIPRYT